MTDDTLDTDGRDGVQQRDPAGGRPTSRRDGRSIADASRRDFLKATAGAGALAAGLGSGVVGSASAQVIPTPPLRVDGNLVKDPDGETVKLRGVNMVDPKRADVTAPARGKNAVQIVDLLTDTDQDWYSRAIRIPVQPVDIGEHQPGEGPEPMAFTENQLRDYLSTHLDPVIERCLQRGAYAIIDYHRHRDVQWTDETLGEEVEMFWDGVAPRYADQPHVMYEVYNEPTEPGMWGDPTQRQNWADTWRDWKATAQPWVDTIRSHAPDNLVLVGSPSWTQSPEGALVEPFDGSNLAYTFHIYPGHNSSTSQNWEDASSSNNGEGVAGVYEEYPLFVTEFGWEQGGGQYIGGTDEFGTAFLEWLESSPAIHWTAWVGDPVWRPVMFERSFAEGGFADNIGNPYEESVPEQCPDLPCEWSLTTGSGGMGDDVKQALIDHRTDNPPTVAYDQQAPSAPTGLSTSNVTETTADVSWSGVSDQGEAGLSHYAVAVDGATVTQVPAGTTGTTVEGLQADSTVTIGVSAVDRARNESAVATTQVTTDGFDDSTAPDSPSNLSWPNITHQSVTASWDAASDEGGSGLDYYVVSVDGTQDQTVADSTSTTITGLSADTSYEVGVSAVDRAGNESDPTTESVTTDLATAGEEDLLINDYDGSPAWPNGNDLGNWNGAGSFANGGGSGEVVDGALELAYDNAGWFVEQVMEDVSAYSELVLAVSGANGGEEREFVVAIGGVRDMLANLADGSIGTDTSEVRIDLADAGVDASSPGEFRMNFWQGARGESTIRIEEIRFE